MLGLTQTATLYKRIGQHAGKPAYAETGSAFRCRVQPEFSRTANGKGVGSDASVRIFAQNIAANTGDRIMLGDGTRLIVSDVQRVHAFRGMHHLEILAGLEG